MITISYNNNKKKPQTKTLNIKLYNKGRQGAERVLVNLSTTCNAEWS